MDVQAATRGKELGAFYTAAPVARFLVWWAVRTAADSVMDPSFGGGVFLHAACERLLALGGDPADQVRGTEIDKAVCNEVAGKLHDTFGVPAKNLLLRDFFTVAPPALAADAVVGNPPFIRYQRFTGDARRRALQCAARQRVRLPELSSSWAPFLVHSTAMVRPGGRLAMVVPFELTHAAYARPVLEHVIRSFQTVTLATFRQKLFPELNEDTLLLLADSKGGEPAGLLWRDFAGPEELAEIAGGNSFQLPRTRRLDAPALAAGRERLAEYYLPEGARVLYRHLQRSPQVQQLGRVADVGIGYVTGANDFFHLSPGDADARDIPSAFLRRAVRRGRALVGLTFTAADWEAAARSGDAGCLLYINGQGELPPPVQDYLAAGERQGIPNAYKCRTRDPWFRVPHVYEADAFLTYMSGNAPRLVANAAGAVAPNTLHVVRLHQESALDAPGLAALWQTSLTRISTEIEGHALGGGMLKLEPTEAERVLVPIPDRRLMPSLAAEIDDRLRRGDAAGAADLADAEILQERLGLDKREVALLREGAETLRARRCPRGSGR